MRIDSSNNFRRTSMARLWVLVHDWSSAIALCYILANSTQFRTGMNQHRTSFIDVGAFYVRHTENGHQQRWQQLHRFETHPSSAAAGGPPPNMKISTRWLIWPWCSGQAHWANQSTSIRLSERPARFHNDHWSAQAGQGRAVPKNSDVYTNTLHLPNAEFPFQTEGGKAIMSTAHAPSTPFSGELRGTLGDFFFFFFFRELHPSPQRVVTVEIRAVYDQWSILIFWIGNKYDE